MISVNELNGLKIFVEVQANTLNNRPMYLITEGDKITWKNSSDVFNADNLNVGSRMWSNSSAVLAISQKKVVTEKIPRSVCGIRLFVNSIPIVNEAGDAVGAFSTLTPRLHPVAAAFYHYAPIMAEMFPEGVLLFSTNLEKYTFRQSSKAFDLPAFKIGDDIKEGEMPFKTIQTRQLSVIEVDASKFGIPILIVSYPLLTEDNELVGTMGMVLPKKIAVELRDMSEDLDNGLSEISSAIEQLASSASQIHENEQILNTNIKGIINLSDEINKISFFIKKIADETKMLGLNAAIEAARAGEVGRGFGVVAEEIRKLSEQSKSAVPQIKELTHKIKIDVDKVIEKSNSSLHASQEQAAASEEITASIEEITSMAAELKRIADKL